MGGGRWDVKGGGWGIEGGGYYSPLLFTATATRYPLTIHYFILLYSHRFEALQVPPDKRVTRPEASDNSCRDEDGGRGWRMRMVDEDGGWRMEDGG